MAGIFGDVFKNLTDTAGGLFGFATNPIGSIEHMLFMLVAVIVGSILGFKLISRIIDRI